MPHADDPNHTEPAAGQAEPATDDMLDDHAAQELLEQLRQLLTAAGAPEQTLRLLDQPGTPTEIVQRLVDAGVMPEPHESVSTMLAEWEPLLAPDIEPLVAEMSGYEFLAIAQGEDSPADRAKVLTALIDQAESHGGSGALAMLRVLAVVTPEEQVRSRAAAAADRLAAGGLADPPWMAGLGAPRAGECCGYVDQDGQRTVLLEFWYGDQPHGLVVLLDDESDGGIRDVWVTDAPDEVRGTFRDDPDQFGAEVDYSRAEAHALLTEALRREPCPVEPDEVEDVQTNLDLLRHRLPLLATPA